MKSCLQKTQFLYHLQIQSTLLNQDLGKKVHRKTTLQGLLVKDNNGWIYCFETISGKMCRFTLCYFVADTIYIILNVNVTIFSKILSLYSLVASTGLSPVTDQILKKWFLPFLRVTGIKIQNYISIIRPLRNMNILCLLSKR